MRLFDGNLAYVDQEVGRAAPGRCRRAGLIGDDGVIVAADHGEQLYEHGYISHNVQLYEQSVRVPLIVRFPAGQGRPACASRPWRT